MWRPGSHSSRAAACQIRTAASPSSQARHHAWSHAPQHVTLPCALRYTAVHCLLVPAERQLSRPLHPATCRLQHCKPGSQAGGALHAGRGRHSNPHIGGVLMDAAKEVLRRQQLPFSVKAGNAGMLDISAEDMAAWSAKRGQQTSKVTHVRDVPYCPGLTFDSLSFCRPCHAPELTLYLHHEWGNVDSHFAGFPTEQAPFRCCAGVACTVHWHALPCVFEHHRQRGCGRCAGAGADVWLVVMTQAYRCNGGRLFLRCMYSQ